MNNRIIIPLLLIFLGVLFSCQKDKKNDITDIKIGKEEATLQEVSINRLTERRIVLSGGNGKFLANVENSKLAQVSVHQDTLKIKGLLEGETFATIFSHDKKAHLKINVVPSQISISQQLVRLYPTEESKFITLTGGGEIVDLDIDDPHNILEVKWNGKTNVLEMRAFYEGEATIVAKSNGVAPQTLKVVVQSEGSLDKIGYYASSSRTLSHSEPKLIVKRAGVGVWLTNGTNPYGIEQGFLRRNSVRISEIANPQQGQNLEVAIKSFPYPESFSVNTGKYPVFVEQIRDTTFVIRGRGFKFVLPK